MLFVFILTALLPYVAGQPLTVADCLMSDFLAEQANYCVENGAPDSEVDTAVTDAATTDMTTVTKPNGTSYTVTCENNYFMNPPGGEVVCIDGSWVGDMPICDAGDCQVVWEDLYGTVTYTLETTGWVTHSGTATLECPAGYTISGESLATCNFGEWDNILGYCAEDMCAAMIALAGAESTITYTDVSAPHDPSSGAYVVCDPGYMLPVGSDGEPDPASYIYTVTCNEAKWENTNIEETLDECTPIGCPANIVDGDNVTMSTTAVDGLVDDGTTAVLTCNTGYTLVGNDTVTCTLGEWLDEFGTCEPDTCTANDVSQCPTAATGSVVTFTDGACGAEIASGESVVVSCMDDYILPVDGDTVLTCIAGQWVGESGDSTALAECEKLPCCTCFTPEATGVDSILYTNSDNSAATNEVDDGGKMVVSCSGEADATILCGVTDPGMWDATPSCSAITPTSPSP